MGFKLSPYVLLGSDHRRPLQEWDNTSPKNDTNKSHAPHSWLSLLASCRGPGVLSLHLYLISLSEV